VQVLAAARAVEAGTSRDSAVVRGQPVDANRSNNVASAAVTITPAPRRRPAPPFTG
jgi:hypothetical protein